MQAEVKAVLIEEVDIISRKFRVYYRSRSWKTITRLKDSEITVKLLNSLNALHSFTFFHIHNTTDFNSNRDDYNDRRQPYANRGFNNNQQARGGRGGPAFRGNFSGRGNMRGGNFAILQTSRE